MSYGGIESRQMEGIVKIERAAFLGGADFQPGDDTYQMAFETARLLAQNGITILNGGGPGVMRAATEGAHEGAGRVTAVTYYPEYKHATYEGVDPENHFDKEIVTPNYFQRTQKLLELSDIHIVFKGGTGTISEFGMSWALSRIHYGHSIPLILFGDFWEDVVGCLRRHMYMRPDEFRVYYIVDSPEQVLETIQSLEYPAS
jgi:uncharacterized protein (TIGR00725 family)